METLLLPRLNTIYRPQLRGLNRLPAINNNKSRLDPNTQMRVITDPLLNISYRRQFEEYERNFFTEVIGRAEGTVIGGALGASVGTIIGAVASFLLPDFGLLIPAGTAAGAAIAGTTATTAGAAAATAATTFVGLKTIGTVAGATIGATGGLIGSDYTTFHAMNDTINTTIIQSFKRSPEAGVLNALSFTGKSMDLIMGGEAIRAIISSVITGSDVFENISRAYGTHEDGRTEYDFSVLREQAGIDLGAFGNFIFDMTGEIITDPGAWGGITGKLLTKGKAAKATVESINTINDVNKIVTKQALSNPKLMKQLSRAFRHGNTDEILSVMKNVVDKRMTKKINKDVLEKFIKEVQDEAMKNTAFRAYKMFNQIDQADDFLTAAIFRTTNFPIGMWHLGKKGAKYFNDNILYKLFKDSPVAEKIEKISDFVFGNKSRVNFIKEVSAPLREYISFKHNGHKYRDIEGTISAFIESDNISLNFETKQKLRDYLKNNPDADINDPVFESFRNAYNKYRDGVIAKMDSKSLENNLELIKLEKEFEDVDEKMETLLEDKRYAIQIKNEFKRERYRKLYKQRQELVDKLKKISKEEQETLWRKRSLNRSSLDKQFYRIMRDLKKLTSLKIDLPSNQKAAQKLIKELVDVLNKSDGEQYLDEIYLANRYQSTFLDFLRKNIDDETTSILESTYKDSSTKYSDDFVKFSSDYRSGILKEEIGRILSTDLDSLTSEGKKSFEELKTKINEIQKLSTTDLDSFEKIMSLINGFKNKYLYKSIDQDSFIIKNDIVKNIELKMKQQAKLVNKQAGLVEIFTNSEVKRADIFGYYPVKEHDSIARLSVEYADFFNQTIDALSSVFLETNDPIINEAVNTINAIHSSYIQVDSSIAKINKVLDYIKSNIYDKGLVNIYKNNPVLQTRLQKLQTLIKSYARKMEEIPNNIIFSKTSIERYITEINRYRSKAKSNEVADFDLLIKQLNEIKETVKEASYGSVIADHIDPIIFRNSPSLFLFNQYIINNVTKSKYEITDSIFEDMESVVRTAKTSLKYITDKNLKLEFTDFISKFEKSIGELKSFDFKKGDPETFKKHTSLLDTYKLLQTKYAIWSMENNMKTIKVSYDDIVKTQLDEINMSTKKIIEFIRTKDGVLFQQVKDADYKSLPNIIKAYRESITDKFDTRNDIVKKIYEEFKAQRYDSKLINYQNTLDVLNRIDSSHYDLIRMQELINKTKEHFNVSSQQLAYGFINDIVNKSNNSLSMIIQSFRNNEIDFKTFMQKIFNSHSRYLTTLNIFKTVDSYVPEIYSRLEKVVSDISKYLSNSFTKAEDIGKFVDDLEIKIKEIDNIQIMGMKNIVLKNRLGLDFSYEFMLYQPKAKYQSNYFKIVESLFKNISTEAKQINLHNFPGLPSQKIIKETLDKMVEKNLDIDNVQILRKLLLDTDLQKYNDELIKGYFPKDFTEFLTKTSIVKHLRQTETLSKVDWTNKSIRDFKYVIIDTETLNKSHGLLSVSYRTVSFDSNGKLIQGDKKVMYLNIDEVQNNIKNKIWDEPDKEIDQLNYKILDKDNRGDSSVGATIELHKRNIERVGGSYSMKEILDEIDQILNNDNAVAIMHNAGFDTKQLLEAKFELDHTTKKQARLFTDNDMFEGYNDFDKMFKLTGYNWTVLDSLDIVNKYNLIETNNLTNIGLGKASLGSEVILKNAEGEIIAQRTYGSPNDKYRIKEIYTVGAEEPEILFNDQPIHLAEIDTELMEAWLDNALNKLFKEDFTMGDFTSNIYSQYSYINDILENKNIHLVSDEKYLDELNSEINNLENLIQIYEYKNVKSKIKLEELKDAKFKLQELYTKRAQHLAVKHQYKDSLPFNLQLKLKLDSLLKRVEKEALYDRGIELFSENILPIITSENFKYDYENLVSVMEELEDVNRYLEDDEIQKLIDDFKIIEQMQQAHNLKNQLFMSRNKDIVYRQQNTAMTTLRLMNSFTYNIDFKELGFIFDGVITGTESTQDYALKCLFNPELITDPVKREELAPFSKMPEVIQIKEAYHNIVDNFKWFQNSIINKLESLGPKYKNHFGIIMQIMNRIDGLTKETAAKVGLTKPISEWSSEVKEELIKSIRDNAKETIGFFRTLDGVFFSDVYDIYESLINRAVEMLEKGKLPYLTPSSQFTNDFYHLIEEGIIRPLKNLEGHRTVSIEGENEAGFLITKGKEYSDSIRNLEEKLHKALQPIRDILKETKHKNRVFKTQPLTLRDISNKMVMDIRSETGSKMFKTLRPYELPLYSENTIVYAKDLKKSMKKKQKANEFFSHFADSYDPFANSGFVASFENSKTSQFLERIANAVGVDPEYLISNLSFVNTELGTELTPLNKEFLDFVINNDLSELFSEEYLQALGEERLFQLRQLAIEIKNLNKDSFRMLSEDKIVQLQNALTTIILDNLLDNKFTKKHWTKGYWKKSSVGYIYERAAKEVSATSDIWRQIQKFYTNPDGTIDAKGISKYFNTNTHEVLVYVDHETGYIRMLNTNNIGLLEQVLKTQDIDIGVMSLDSFTKYAGIYQRREIKNPVLKWIKDVVIRNLKIMSLTFSVPFLASNALAATLQDISSTEGTLGIASFIKNFSEAFNEYRLWKEPYEIIGTSYVSYYYRKVHPEFKDWADYIDSDDFKKYLQDIINDPKSHPELIADKSLEKIQEEAQSIFKLIDSYSSEDLSKIKGFNEYMRTASVSGQSAEFNNKDRIRDAQKENLDNLKKYHDEVDSTDMRYYIFRDTPNSKTAIKEMGFKGEVPEFKTIEDEFKWLKEQKKLNGDLHHRRNQLENMISRKTSEWATEWVDKLKLPKMFLDFNGDMETVFRTTMLKSLMKDGASLDEAAAEVIKRHFLYTDKSVAEQMSEFIIPFISYPLRSLDLFDGLIDDSSFMEMMYLWDKYSWGDAEEQRKHSDYLTYRKAKGDIPIGNELLNLGNPLTESMMLAANPGRSWGNKLNPIIRTATGMSPATQLPGVSQVSSLTQGLNAVVNEGGSPARLLGLSNTFYRNNQYFYSKQPFTTKVKPFYNKLYTSSGFSRVAMRMQTTTLKNVQYRVGDILYNRKIM